MRIALVTDAWHPQVNGVVTTLSRTRECLIRMNHEVLVCSAEGLTSVPCPTYPEIRLAVLPRRALAARLGEFRPASIHVATEGPMGMGARAYCLRRNLAFTTSYHTQFPQYVRKRVPVPEAWSYAYLRHHHNAGRRVLVPTRQQQLELQRRGFRDVVIWSRGVDTEVFAPDERTHLSAPRPIFMYAGRVAVEKNVDAFLSLELPGSKYVVGDGPDMAALRRKYPRVVFVGYQFGKALASHLSAADVFVFPSRTDTFGLVMLEAMACGTPVAAFPVTGPIDVVETGRNGMLDDDLGRAALGALSIERRRCRQTALERTWEKATSQFLSHLVDAGSGADLGTRYPSLQPQARFRRKPMRRIRHESETTGCHNGFG